MSRPTKQFKISECYCTVRLFFFAIDLNFCITIGTEGKPECGSVRLHKGLSSSCRGGVTFSSSLLLFIAVSFDREALIAASFPNITHQQQGETASKLKLNHNVWTSVTTCQPCPITDYFALLTIFLYKYLRKKYTTAANSTTFYPELKQKKKKNTTSTVAERKQFWLPLTQKTYQLGLYHNVQQIVLQCISISTLILGLPTSVRFSPQWGLITRVYGPRGKPPSSQIAVVIR